MKSIATFILFFVFSQNLKAQIFISKECKISFFSSTPMEDISARNTNAVPILNTATNEIAVKVPNTSFVFKSQLMQEHFNENYMESEKFPFTIFKGKIKETIDFSKKACFVATVTGNLEMHGVEKCIVISGTLTPGDDGIVLDAKFMVKLSDYDIKIPTILTKSIAEDVEIKISSTLQPYVKN